MTDYFALLGLCRRPWLDPDEIKARYHDLTVRHHPDVEGASADFSEINRAFQTLSDPAARLRHLLELEIPAASNRAQSVPAEIADFFPRVADASQAVDAFLKKREAAASPLAKALLSKEQFAVQERLEEVLTALQQKQDAILLALCDADARWSTDRSAVLDVLSSMSQALGYIARWLGTLRESLFKLASL